MYKVILNKNTLTDFDVKLTSLNIGQWWNWTKKCIPQHNQENTGLYQRRAPEAKRGKAVNHTQ